MPGQEQRDKYMMQPAAPKDPKTMYQGPKKLEGVKDLLDGIDDLVAKDDLASKYRQSGGQ
jgi:hypothetical protein